jgi:methyltransferase (TIGR00027 family)
MLTVSDTAYTVALVRALEAELPAAERLFEDPFAAIFAAGGAHAAVGTQRFFELAFMREGVRLRTRFIDDFVREGLASGITQIVLFGAGFDARGLRMPEIAAHDARVFEVDFAALLTRKRELLAAAGVALPERIAYVACDFMAPDFEATLAAALEASGLRRGAGALFVWEGVLPYIDNAAVDRSLAFMARTGGRGTRVVFEFAKERFEPASAAEHTRRAGFTSFDDVTCDVLWRRHMPGDPHPAAAIIRMGTATV